MYKYVLSFTISPGPLQTESIRITEQFNPLNLHLTTYPHANMSESSGMPLVRYSQYFSSPLLPLPFN